MPLPNTFLVGAPKCGTTALAEYISDHPGVFFCKPKEPFYWASDLVAAPHEHRPANLKEYGDLFSGATESHRVIAEGSTSYLRSTLAIPDILEFNPKSRFIVMLRNPVDVVQAFHMEQLYSQHEDIKDFSKAWAIQSEREEGRCMPKRSFGGDFVLYRKAASFASQLERFIQLVPEDQRKIILFDDFVADTRSVYLDVLDFLDLNDDGRVQFEKVNGSHAQRFPSLARFILYPPKILENSIRRLRRIIIESPPPGVRQLKAMMNTTRERKKVDRSTHKDLCEYFSPDVEKLGSLLGRDLMHWVEK